MASWGTVTPRTREVLKFQVNNMLIAGFIVYIFFKGIKGYNRYIRCDSQGYWWKKTNNNVK